MIEITKGTLVRVSKDLTETYSRYGRSSNGEMDRMKGGIFRVYESHGRRATIRNPEAPKNKYMVFTFHIGDLEVIASKYKEPEPKVFEFDISHLDI